jgi:hypothetical protein
LLTVRTKRKKDKTLKKNIDEVLGNKSIHSDMDLSMLLRDLLAGV